MDASPPVSIPRLETKRLLLREYRMADFEAFAAFVSDEEASRFTVLCDRRNAWRVFGCQTGTWLLQGAGWWAVELRETGEVAGLVGAFFREGWPEIELGWNTYRAHWRKGIASEAAAAVVRYAFEVRREKRVTALIDAQNAASLGVAASLDLRHESDAELFGKVVGRYVRSAVPE
jgi:RimJ/RimL family protein N-acetyltransferase